MTPGARYILYSTFFFAIMQVCVKNLAHLPTSQVVLARAFISLVICWFWLRRSGVSVWGKHRGLLIARGVAGTIALFLFFFTVQNMPLASAVTLQYLSPVFTVIIASLVLREHASWVQWAFMLLSFLGVALIQGFDQRVSLPLAGLCLFSAFMSAVAYNLIRKIGTREQPLVIVFYFPLVTTVALGPVALWQWQTPQGVEWFYLLMTGVSVHFAQVFMTKAYQREKAANVVTLKYVGAIFALAIGYFGFDESYPESALIGMLMVALGAIGASRAAIKHAKMQ